jgi:Transposase DDE domain
MTHPTTPRLRAAIHRLGNPKAPQPELGLEAVLPKAQVERVLTEEGGWWKAILYTPWVTFWAFFWQRLSADRSCRAALKRLAAWMALRGRKLSDADTGPYCKARARLPESALHRLMCQLGVQTHHGASAAWLWCARRVKMVDGSTAIMADTVANQRAYPQSPSQRPGLGLPIARFVVLFCLATGSVLEAAIGRYQGKQTGENALFRSLWDELEPGDVVLGDRYFGSYFDIVLLKQRGVDSVFRLHQRRTCDFRRGQRLGREDQIVRWDRPARPDWMDPATYDRVDATVEVRMLRIRVAQRGFRTRVLEVVTTLLDAEIYTKKDIAILYRKRWHAELDLRSIKVALGMDLLLSKTPEMVRKEIWMSLLAYNVVRALLAKAGLAHQREVRRLSFKGALQTIQEFGPALRDASSPGRPWSWRALLSSIAADEEGYRPDRAEPRARKRRPKPYPLLTKPRKQAKAALLRAG